jgi:hypothetical protein
MRGSAEVASVGSALSSPQKASHMDQVVVAADDLPVEVPEATESKTSRISSQTRWRTSGGQLSKKDW